MDFGNSGYASSGESTTELASKQKGESSREWRIEGDYLTSILLIDAQTLRAQVRQGETAMTGKTKLLSTDVALFCMNLLPTPQTVEDEEAEQELER